MTTNREALGSGTHRALLAVLMALTAVGSRARADDAPKGTATAPVAAERGRDAKSFYESRPGSPDGIGKWYMGREIAQVMGHQGADSRYST